jgi:Zn-dependent oligopeptidase
MNPKLGKELKEKVLEKGASREENHIIRDFLQREPGYEAFLESIGVR